MIELSRDDKEIDLAQVESIRVMAMDVIQQMGHKYGVLQEEVDYTMFEISSILSDFKRGL